MNAAAIIHTIDTSLMNRGLKGRDWLADSRNIAIVDGDDLTLFDYEAPGIYQIHLLFGSSRGRAAVEQVKAATVAMFSDHGAQVLFGLVPDVRRDVKLIGRLAGWRSAGKRQHLGDLFEIFTIHKGMVH